MRPPFHEFCHMEQCLHTAQSSACKRKEFMLSLYEDKESMATNVRYAVLLRYMLRSLVILLFLADFQR